ncbi:MAG: hypothetical protein ABIJ40_04110 [Bacteroidota bacterium]
MSTKQITPHKGGRDLMIRARVSQKEKDVIDEARKNLSYADYIIKKALKDVRRKNV